MSSPRPIGLTVSYSNDEEMQALAGTIQSANKRIYDFFNLVQISRNITFLNEGQANRLRKYAYFVKNYRPEEYCYYLSNLGASSLRLSFLGGRFISPPSARTIAAGQYVVKVGYQNQLLYPYEVSEQPDQSVRVSGFLSSRGDNASVAFLSDHNYRVTSLVYKHQMDSVRIIFDDKAIAALPQSIRMAFYPEYEAYHATRKTLLAEEKHFSQASTATFYKAADYTPFLTELVMDLIPGSKPKICCNSELKQASVEELVEEELEKVKSYLLKQSMSEEGVKLTKNESGQPILTLHDLNYKQLRDMALTLAVQKTVPVSVVRHCK